MACEVVRMPGGGTAIACGPRRRERGKSYCYACGAESAALCDGPSRGPYSTTCSRPVCATHRHAIGKDRDLCPECWEAAGRPKLSL